MLPNGNKSLLDYGCAVPNDRQIDTLEIFQVLQSEETTRSLAPKVNAALKEGWQPLGAPFVHGSGAAVICCQAMVNFHQLTGA